jgi:serine/threonine protein kinase
MRHLSHPNTMKLEEVFETENSLYMVFEILEGGNLSHLLRKSGPIPEYKIRPILKGILNGIKYLHERGVIHRDIKPENILFRKKNSESSTFISSNNNVGLDRPNEQKLNNWEEADICLADFGLSTFSNLKKFLYPRCGTPGFVAPEVINIKNMDQIYGDICDEFSCGLVFHYMF